jgi:putative transposase
MARWLVSFLRFLVASFKSRRNLLLENLALRHQLLVLNRTSKQPRLMPLDRALWAWLSQNWHAWKTHVLIVQPDTVIRCHRKGFRLFWKWKKPSP